MPVYRSEEMKSFLCASVSIATVLTSVFSFVSCGSRSQDSDLTNHNHANRRRSRSADSRPNPEYQNDTLPGQVNGSTEGRFPQSPDLNETPGSLCQKPGTYRYPEHVMYCERDVDSSLKMQLFLNYDAKFGFETSHMARSLFKIDHLIPLCLGGSNEATNLWPQHVSIYTQTDPLEPYLCGLLAEQKLTQAEAVKIIRTIKQSPFTAGEELAKLEARY
jgi:hypothetical protein